MMWRLHTGAGFGAFGFWRVRRYQQVHAIYHFSSHYMPVATNVPDHMFSFYPGPLSYCGEGKVSFGARIGFSKHDSMRRLVIDLPKGCEIETAKYAMQHRQEIKDRITEDMRNAEPDLLSGISIDRIVILSHRHILSNSAHMAIGKDTEGEYFVEGPTQD